MKRLIRLHKSHDDDFNFEKAVNDFKKKNKIKRQDVKNKSSKNPLYKQWSNYMTQNYPIWSMSSPAYILRGWNYICNGSSYWYGGNNQDNDNDYDNNDDDSNDDSNDDSDIGSDLDDDDGGDE